MSGTTLTFTGAPPSGTNNIYVVHQAKSVGTIDPPATETVAKTFSGATTVSGALVASSTTLVDTLGVKTAKDLGVGIHVRSADSGASANSLADELVLENSGSSGLTIASGTSSSGSIYFGDSGDDDIGKIAYSHSTNSMSFTTNTAVGLKIDNAGHVTKPLQPFFAANATSTNIALTTQVTVQLNERIDTNGDLASNTFTAPVTGRYYLGYHFYLTQLDADHSALDVKIATSNKTYAVTYKPESTFSGDVNFGVTGSQICDMDAGDTATFVIYISGGAAQTDVHADSTASGMLIG